MSIASYKLAKFRHSHAHQQQEENSYIVSAIFFADNMRERSEYVCSTSAYTVILLAIYRYYTELSCKNKSNCFSLSKLVINASHQSGKHQKRALQE